MTQADLLKQTAERIRSIAEDTHLLTSGNVSHLACNIRGKLLRNAELIEKYLNGGFQFDKPQEEELTNSAIDAFIEKACGFLQKEVLDDYPGVVWEGLIDAFKAHMKRDQVFDVTDRVAEAVNIAQKTRKSLCPRLRRLEMLLEAADSLRKEEPHLELGDIPERVRALLLDEYRKLNWHVVSPIVNGCAQEAIYEGTPEDCKKYVQRLVEKDPAIKNNLIVTPV